MIPAHGWLTVLVCAWLQGRKGILEGSDRGKPLISWGQRVKEDTEGETYLSLSHPEGSAGNQPTS